jgi:hypothetical protein
MDETGRRSERRPDRLSTEAYAIEISDEDLFTTGMNEPVYRQRKTNRTHELADGYMMVLPTLNGLHPSTAFDEVAFAGCSVKGVNYSRNKPIAIKQSGKAKLLHTGTKPIRAGQWVELYAMPIAEANAFKAKHNTTRIMAGIRETQPGVGDLYTKYGDYLSARRGAIGELTDATDNEKALLKTMRETSDAGDPKGWMAFLKAADAYRAQRQTQVIGRALHNAHPGQYFEMLLSQHTPG